MTDPNRAEPDVGATAWRPGRVGLTLAALVLVFAGAVGGWLVARDDAPSFNDADVGFLDDMVQHHSGAITIGFEYLQARGDGPMGHYAREIVIEQSQEVAQMNALLSEVDDHETIGDGVSMEWMGHPIRTRRMPGLATTDQITRLGAARELAADDLFSELMIRHHAAGVAMADEAAALGTNATVARLARAMARVQRQEMAAMNAARATLGLAAVATDPPTSHG
ncbi:MAG: DUF305 domain-containing protein [Acidimicrobiia bacterium]